jgi:hypothetical protein
MKVDDAFETISRFFNDLIGSLVPGAVLAVGLAVMHLGPGKIVEMSKALDSAALALIVVGIMFAAGHVLMAAFEVALQRLLRTCHLVKAFDEVEARKRQSFEFFAEIVHKLRGGDASGAPAKWTYNDLRSVALSVSAEGASVSRRFMFISLLCNGVATALMIILVDFLCCLALSPGLLFPYDLAPLWFVQSALMLVAAAALFKRGEVFYARAMTTPFSVAVAELKLKRESDVAK